MSTEPIGIDPYEAALADLRKKRDHIDSLIAAIENFRAGGGTVPVGTTPAAPGGSVPPADGPGAYLGMSIVNATKKLLAVRHQPLKVAEILASLKAGGLVLTSNEPGNVIGSVLTRHFYDVGDIVRVERGLWGLKEWYPGRTFSKNKAENGEKAENGPNKDDAQRDAVGLSLKEKLAVKRTKAAASGSGQP